MDSRQISADRARRSGQRQDENASNGSRGAGCLRLLSIQSVALSHEMKGRPASQSTRLRLVTKSASYHAGVGLNGFAEGRVRTVESVDQRLLSF